MEFSDIQALLFTTKWTTVEESQAEFLSNHEKLTELSEEDIRTAPAQSSPKTDRQRLLADKVDNSEIEKMIETVRSTRNDIANCKFFYKEEYDIFNKAVTDLNHLILKAIQLTEEKDFVHKQAESSRIALAGIADTLAQFQKYIKDSISSSLQSFSLVRTEVRKSFDLNLVLIFQI